MIGRATHCRPAVSFTGALGLALAASTSAADAAVISATPGIDFSSQAATITFGSSSFIFSEIPGAPPGDPPAVVSTTGSAKVSSLFGNVTDFGAASTIDQTGEIYTFSAFAAPAVIPNSATDDFLGLAFTLADGLHYGYAEVSGTNLISDGFQQVPGASILTGSVPEPATLAVFGTGLLGLAYAQRRRLG